MTALVETLAADAERRDRPLGHPRARAGAPDSTSSRALHSALGFIPLFGEPSSAGPSIFTAIVVLTIMILPIVSSISRELFLGVPHDLKEGALALGTTRWEMVRGVMFPYARGGIAAALILGLGRAIGEAIAVTQVIGGGVFIHWNLFARRRHARRARSPPRIRARRASSRPRR